MTAPQSPIQAALAAEREQWTGEPATNAEHLREEHERLLRVATPCDQLAVCQDRRPRCKGCKPSEGAESVQNLLAVLSKRPNLPLDQGVK